MRLKNERPRLSKTVDDVVATIRMTLRNHANKFDEFWRIWRSIICCNDCLSSIEDYCQTETTNFDLNGVPYIRQKNSF